MTLSEPKHPRLDFWAFLRMKGGPVCVCLFLCVSIVVFPTSPLICGSTPNFNAPRYIQDGPSARSGQSEPTSKRTKDSPFWVPRWEICVLHSLLNVKCQYMKGLLTESIQHYGRL